jgi:MFS family permease
MKQSQGMSAALRHRDFRRLIESAAASQIGDWLYNVALAVYAFERTHSAAWIGLMTLLRLIPYVLLAPFGGVIADRYERRAVLIVSDVLRAVLMTALALAVASGAPVLVAGLLASLTTVAGTAYFPATVSLIPDVLGEDDLVSGNSIISIVQSASIVVGPAIGGVLLSIAAPTWSFVANAATFALGATLTATIATRSRAQGENREESGRMARFLAELGGGFKVLREFSIVRVLTSLAVATSFMYGTFTVLLVIIAGERVGHDASRVGYLYGALGLGGLFGAPVAARLARHPRLGGVALAALGVAAFPIALLWAVHGAVLAFLLITCSGMAQVVVDVLAITLLQRNVANEVTGRVFGIFDASTVGAMIAGSLIVAPLRDVFGFGPMLLVVAAVGPLIVIAQLGALLHADRDAAITWWQLQRVVDDLRRVSLFAALRDGALERLARGAEKERFAGGETIILQGERGTHCYTVLYGTVAVRRGGADGEVIATLGEDDHFGEIGLLHDVPRTATVTAASECVLYAIDAETFKGALDADAKVASQAFESAAARLSMLSR